MPKNTNRETGVTERGKIGGWIGFIRVVVGGLDGTCRGAAHAFASSLVCTSPVIPCLSVVVLLQR